MDGYIRLPRQPVDMAATERPTFRMGHLTVVPTNFESADVDALEDRADRESGTADR